MDRMVRAAQITAAAIEMARDEGYRRGKQEGLRAVTQAERKIAIAAFEFLHEGTDATVRRDLREFLKSYRAEKKKGGTK
jgi:hypothetical protein